MTTPLRCRCEREHQVPLEDGPFVCPCGQSYAILSDLAGGFYLYGDGALAGLIGDNGAPPLRHIRASDIAAAKGTSVVGV